MPRRAEGWRSESGAAVVAGSRAERGPQQRKGKGRRGSRAEAQGWD